MCGEPSPAEGNGGKVNDAEHREANQPVGQNPKRNASTDEHNASSHQYEAGRRADGKLE